MSIPNQRANPRLTPALPPGTICTTQLPTPVGVEPSGPFFGAFPLEVDPCFICDRFDSGLDVSVNKKKKRLLFLFFLLSVYDN